MIVVPKDLNPGALSDTYFVYHTLANDTMVPIAKS